MAINRNLSAKDFKDMQSDPNNPKWYTVKKKENTYFVIGQGCRIDAYKNYLYFGWKDKRVFAIAPQNDFGVFRHVDMVSFCCKFLKIPMEDINSGKDFWYHTGITAFFDEPIWYKPKTGKGNLEEVIAWKEGGEPSDKIKEIFLKIVESLPRSRVHQINRLKLKDKKVIKKPNIIRKSRAI